MRLFFLFFVAFGAAFSCIGQNYVWSGRVVDAESGLPLEGINISFGDDKWMTSSNKKGEFEIPFSFENKSKWRVEFSRVAYESTFVVIDRKNFKNFSLTKDVILTSQTIQFPSVDISLKRIPPDTVYGLPTYNIGDFCFVQHHTLLLTYTKEKRWKKAEDQKKTFYDGCRLELLDSSNKKVDEIVLDGVYYGIYTQYLNEVFLTSPTTNYRVIVDEHQIALEPIAMDSFLSCVKPVVDSSENCVIATTFNPQIPAFEYYSFEKNDSIYRTIHHVEDAEVLSVFRSEYKYLDGRGKLNAARYEQETGVEKEIIAAFMSGFANSIFVKPLYAPAFSVDDTLLIFDHYKDKIYKFNKRQELVDSVSITYHKLKKKIRWKKEIIRDKTNGKFYAIFEKNGYAFLYQINVFTGEIESINKLYYRYAERLRVKNNEVYYIYRPFESSQKKFLYKEKL